MRVKESGFKAAEHHSKGNQVQSPGGLAGYTPYVISKMMTELNALKRKGREQAAGQGKRARNQATPHGGRQTTKHMLSHSGPGTQRSKKGKSKGKG